MIGTVAKDKARLWWKGPECAGFFSTKCIKKNFLFPKSWLQQVNGIILKGEKWIFKSCEAFLNAFESFRTFFPLNSIKNYTHILYKCCSLSHPVKHGTFLFSKLKEREKCIYILHWGTCMFDLETPMNGRLMVLL